MIIIQVMGGLGNQLQQYALYQKFLHMGKEVKLDTSWFKQIGTNATARELELAYFTNLPYEECTIEEKIALIGSGNIAGKLRRRLLPKTIHWFHESQIYQPEILTYNHMYLSGFFACEKYYADILDLLRDQIQFPVEKDTLNWLMAQEMQSLESVSVHIRRADYLSEENKTMFGNICTDLYYQSAMESIQERIQGVHFYLFSDDPDYTRKHYQGTQYTIVDMNHGRDSYFDMFLMSQCRHNICANSTFSFWGARLNRNPNKKMIRPTIHKNGQIFDEDRMKELWRGWDFVDANGKKYENNY